MHNRVGNVKSNHPKRTKDHNQIKMFGQNEDRPQNRHETKTEKHSEYFSICIFLIISASALILPTLFAYLSNNSRSNDQNNLLPPGATLPILRLGR